ncbi:hypothetical protein [Pseudoalteromonas arctica]|uniref:Uncharacterized protein n=1 Tax=Pseudoalteromonas arctica TaxID=394751 RepID=A0A7Y0DVP6_9GAMM|nr:hypothetical protein [Pseudoalteromonas arctica]NMM42479.1 hypothetical protein [Pseudoalteromonas arctica]
MKIKSMIAITISISYLLSTNSVSAASPENVADILGRDLNVPVIGSLGHVGLWTGSEVLEVLDTEAVIEVNSLSSFVNETEYWGYKVRNPKIHINNRENIIKFGLQQKEFLPSYSLSFMYVAGRWEFKRVYNPVTKDWERKRVIAQKGEFRCDTFIEFAWKRANEKRPYGDTPYVMYSNY